MSRLKEMKNMIAKDDAIMTAEDLLKTILFFVGGLIAFVILYPKPNEPPSSNNNQLD